MAEFLCIRKKLLRQYFWPGDFRARVLGSMIRAQNWYVYKFMLYLRWYELLITKKTNLMITALRLWCLRKYTRYQVILGFTIGDGVLGEDVVFYHSGNIIINPKARVGAGCKFHGDCCIGVSHTGAEGAPVLGKMWILESERKSWETSILRMIS